jgi:hypothetical protein
MNECEKESAMRNGHGHEMGVNGEEEEKERDEEVRKRGLL